MDKNHRITIPVDLNKEPPQGRVCPRCGTHRGIYHRSGVHFEFEVYCASNTCEGVHWCPDDGFWRIAQYLCYTLAKPFPI